ncbi:MAG: OmpA family protein [Clostridiales bacterium]|nr:OmpA family protein [Clostridiales bacterium]
MATYSDLVTLLFCFFVLLYAMSKPDVNKLLQISQSIGQNLSIIDWSSGTTILEAMGNGIIEMPLITESGSGGKSKEGDSGEVADTPENVSPQGDFPTYQEFSTFNNVQIEATAHSLKFNLGDMLFDSGSDILKPEATEILDFVTREYLGNYPDYEIYIEGHTDNRPISTARFPDNWSLSSGRAESVGRYFIEFCAVAPERITAIGRGEYQPIATNDTAEGRQQNRRVEIRIVKSIAEESEITSSISEEEREITALTNIEG